MDREQFFANLTHYEELVALAGSERVGAYTRTSKTGKTVHVSAYTRDPGEMPNADLFKEYKELSSGKADLPETAQRARMGKIVSEIRNRKQKGQWGPQPDAAKPAAPDAAKPAAPDAAKPDAPDAPDAAKPDAPDAPDAAKPDAPADTPETDAPHVDSPLLDRLAKAHGAKGTATGKGTIEDPINCKGDVVLAAKHLAEGKHVRLNKVHKIGTLLDELNRMVDEAKSLGEDAPTFDLCKVSVPKTNLFCAESKGIPRSKMPQFGGTPKDGTKASMLPRDKKGEVNIEDHFREELKARGIGIETKEVSASFLKASQAELDGPKVAGMSRAMEQGKVRDAPIFVTKDGYIIDGHHRWASKVAIDSKDGALGDVNMPVEMLDMEIGEALAFANAFALAMGIKPKGLGAAAEGVPTTTAAERATTAVDKLISLSQRTRVEAYTRKTKTGQTVHVDAHLRSVENMSPADLFKEYQSLTSGGAPTDPQERNRMAQIVTEMRTRRQRTSVPEKSQAGESLAEARLSAPLSESEIGELQGSGPSSADAHLVSDEHGNVTFSEDRQKLHLQILSKVLDGFESQENPKFHMMGGGPASGKSVMEANNPEISEGHALLNPDDIKAVLPEYHKADGSKDAGFTHEESSYLAKKIQAEAFHRRVNLTLDGTGDSSATKLRGKIRAARDAGYAVHAYYVTCDIDTAIDRAMQRAQKTGRFVAAPVIRATHVGVSETFPIVLNDFDSAKLYDTNGEGILIGEKRSGGSFRIYNHNLWKRFLAKAGEGSK